MTIWHICPICNGNGSHSQRLGQLDLTEWSRSELKEYFNGAYDDQCDTCKGAGKITEDQMDALDALEDDWDYQVRMAEQSMGA